MSAMALDQSLDTIIKSKRGNKKSVKKGAAANGAGKKKVSSVSAAAKKVNITGKQKAAAAAVQAMANPGKAQAASASNKINVSNLPPDVKETEVRELFSTTVGPLREVTLHYDAKGHSKGMGTVVFQKKEDAAEAVKKYHGRLIDGRA